jgi:hypothetical protein
MASLTQVKGDRSGDSKAARPKLTQVLEILLQNSCKAQLLILRDQRTWLDLNKLTSRLVNLLFELIFLPIQSILKLIQKIGDRPR